MPILKCHNISKSYTIGSTSKKIIDDVSLTIDEGAFVSIMGRSGSGKSTLLNILCGLIVPDCGSVEVCGQSLKTLSEKQKGQFRSLKIGIIFQENNLIDEFSVEDNILTPAYISRKKPDNSYLNSLLDFTGLSNHRAHRAELLSGGQKQRTAIARALINRPQIIFADEPTGSLDSVAAADIMQLFKRIGAEYGVTIIQVTHSNDCAQAGTEIITLNDGKICHSTLNT